MIGYGNELRGDDAIGPRVAELMAARALPGVRAISARQLTPELAEQLAHAGLAIFVDAYPAAHAGEPAVLARPLTPADVGAALVHTSDPRALLALALALYGRAPPAWQVAAPAVTFDLGAPLSPTAEQGIDAALARIVELAQQADEVSPPSVGDTRGRPGRLCRPQRRYFVDRAWGSEGGSAAPREDISFDRAWDLGAALPPPEKIFLSIVRGGLALPPQKDIFVDRAGGFAAGTIDK